MARATLPASPFNPHDFAVAPRHYLFFQPAASLSLARYVLGMAGPAQCVSIDGAAPSAVHVVPRGASHPPRARAVALAADPVFLVHHAHAWEDAATGEVVVWSTGWGPEALAPPPPGGMLGSWKVVLDGDFDGIPYTSLWEHRVHVEAGTVARRALFDARAMEHAKTNPRLATRRPRHVHFTAAAGGAPGKAAPPQAFASLDTETGVAAFFEPGPRCFTEEIVFVPGPAGAADELDGHLLAMVFDAATATSALYILDARDVAAGPVAVVRLSHHVPHGLHGDCATKCLSTGELGGGGGGFGGGRLRVWFGVN